MSVRTTLNISKSSLAKIAKASSITGMTKNDIVITLIKRISLINGKYHTSKILKFASQVRYQEREKDSTNWYKLHIRFVAGDYEHVLDLKKILKMSVSYILAESVEKYLSEIIKSIQNEENMDSYRCSDYAISFELVDGIACWKLYWGIPPSLAAG